jgi:hypothetical protein
VPDATTRLRCAWHDDARNRCVLDAGHPGGHSFSASPASPSLDVAAARDALDKVQRFLKHRSDCNKSGSVPFTLAAYDQWVRKGCTCGLDALLPHLLALREALPDVMDAAKERDAEWLLSAALMQVVDDVYAGREIDAECAAVAPSTSEKLAKIGLRLHLAERRASEAEARATRAETGAAEWEREHVELSKAYSNELSHVAQLQRENERLTRAHSSTARALAEARDALAKATTPDVFGDHHDGVYPDDDLFSLADGLNVRPGGVGRTAWSNRALEPWWVAHVVRSLDEHGDPDETDVEIHPTEEAARKACADALDAARTSPAPTTPTTETSDGNA